MSKNNGLAQKICSLSVLITPRLLTLTGQSSEAELEVVLICSIHWDTSLVYTVIGDQSRWTKSANQL